MSLVEISVAATGGQRVIALIDEADAASLAPWAWRLGTDGYARRKRRVADGPDAPCWIAMHREVLGLHKQRGTCGQDVDHIDGNRLNNSRSNLRLATRSQNNINRKAREGHFLGVTRYNHTQVARPWMAYVNKDGCHHHVGYFATPEEAARARDAKVSELFGDHAALNFPKEAACL